MTERKPMEPAITFNVEGRDIRCYTADQIREAVERAAKLTEANTDLALYGAAVYDMKRALLHELGTEDR